MVAMSEAEDGPDMLLWSTVVGMMDVSESSAAVARRWEEGRIGMRGEPAQRLMVARKVISRVRQR